MPGTHLRSVLATVEARASTQLGLFTLAEARALGLRQQAVSYHAGPGGKWRRVFPEVYELTGLPPDPRRPMLAAQPSAGPGAVLSHRAAGLILGLDGIRDPLPEILSAETKAAKGVVVHRGTVADNDITTTGHLRHTKIVRTVLDLETRYVQLLRTVDVPAPVRQYRVVDDNHHVLGRLDLCWPQAKLWVELDGRAWHDRPDALFRDRHRQNDVVAELQWLPLRFTWVDVVHHPSDTASQTGLVYRRRMALAWRGGGGFSPTVTSDQITNTL